MLTIHHLRVSQSDRIVWLCEELELPYELVLYQRDPVTRAATEAYRQLHPSGTAPVITDGDLVLAETGAIVEYLLTRQGHGRLVVRPGDPHYTDYLYWYHMANGSLMPAMMMLLAEGPIIPFMQARIDRYLRALDDHLAQGNTWLAGETFTVADIMMAFPLTSMGAFVKVDVSAYPHIGAYIKRLQARPAYQRAMAKAEPA